MSINPMQRDELTEAQREHEGFRVTDISSANWCMRKLQALAAKENEVNTLADDEAQRIEAWREGELKGVAIHREFFEGLLAEWHREQLEINPKGNKSIKLPYGTLKSVTRGLQPKKVNDETLLAHIKASGATEYIKTVESPAWAEYKKTLNIHHRENGTMTIVDANGQEVAGVEVDMGGTRFSVEVSY